MSIINQIHSFENTYFPERQRDITFYFELFIYITWLLIRVTVSQWVRKDWLCRKRRETKKEKSRRSTHRGSDRFMEKNKGGKWVENIAGLFLGRKTVHSKYSRLIFRKTVNFNIRWQLWIIIFCFINHLLHTWSKVYHFRVVYVLLILAIWFLCLTTFDTYLVLK